MASTCMERLLNSRLKSLHILPAFRTAVTFCLVSFAWVFFRAENNREALLVVRKFTRIPLELFQFLNLSIEGDMGQVVGNFLCFSACGSFIGFLKMLCPLAVLICVEVLTHGRNGLEMLNKKRSAVRWAIYAICVMALVYALPFTFSLKDLNSYSTDFIYQNF